MRLLSWMIGVAALSVATPVRAERPDIRFSAGGWGLAPFTSVVESQGEKLIENLVVGRIGEIAPQLVSMTSEQQVDFRSSGAFVSIGIDCPVRGGAFRLGGALNYIRFDIPYSVRMKQSLAIVGVAVATASTTGEGTLRLRGIGATASGEWDFLRREHLRLGLIGGISVLPISGDANITGKTDVSTPFGDLHIEGSRAARLSDIRKGIQSVPSTIVSPMLGVSARFRAGSRTSLCTQVVFSQGVFVSAGLGFSL